MRRVLLVLVVVALAVGGGFMLASRNTPPQTGQTTYQNDGKVKVPRATVENGEVKIKEDPAQVSATGDPVEQTLKKLLESADRPKGMRIFPKGTKLKGVKVEDGVATVELSSELNQLNEGGGDSGVAATQNALRKALAQFPQVKTMKVVVDGKVFEDAHSGDWGAIPVRDENASGGAAQ